MEKLVLDIYATEVKNGKVSFIACSTKIEGVFFKVKFRKNCKDMPREVGLYKMTLNMSQFSNQKSQEYIDREGNVKLGNPVLWVHDYEELRKLTDEEMKEIQIEKNKSMFSSLKKLNEDLQ